MALRISQLARSSRELPDGPQTRSQIKPSPAPQSAPPPLPSDAVAPLQVYRHLVKAGQSTYDAPTEGRIPDPVQITGVLRQAYSLSKIGRVVATSKLHPTSPTLEILPDRHHRRLESHEALDLCQEPMLYITDPAIDEDVLEK